MRSPNAIDFWRGMALVMIFINHIPGTAFSSLTLRNYAISDAAELFVFLAGCSLSYLTGSPGSRRSGAHIARRLVRRAFEIWRAQIAVISVAIALLAAGALAWNDPLLLEWHNAGPAFFDTARSSIGLVLLTYQVGYFNILPLYVALLLLAPAFVLVALWNRAAAMALSIALYAAVLAYEIQLPSWPTQGAWFFNPLSWQLLLVLGFLSNDFLRENADFRKLLEKAWPAAAALALAGTAIVWFDVRPDPLGVPEPRLFFLFDKRYLSPARIVSMLALAVAFYPAFALLLPRFGPLVNYVASLGRNSLAVFCVASVLALTGQIIRYLWAPHFLLDFALIFIGLAAMRLTAWLADLEVSNR